MRWPAILFLALSWLPPAQGQNLPRNAGPDRPEIRGAGRATEARPLRAPRVSAAALASARAYLCPHGGTPQGRGRCTRGPGIGAVGTGWLGDDPAVRDWDQGLPPPTRAQLPCPPGTTATQARDQPGVTRCVAG
ncbi:hypothetical protein [Sediminicoccus sp. KRV36]|uniref:hypothetical protein n=1 Tax=Sediminicoccus sp. KRV36 TaxID=3133721 RepID=UPI00200F682F|nr:hypothetical protein [Sediminicoccus rosea]UPY36776.1 hypothetical protein LHU95_21560 [Sediminicoccus rosea]